VRLVLNTTETGSAAVVQQLDYDEWGNVTGLVDPICTQGGTTLCLQPFGFAGGVFDVSTGIVRFGVRDYDPQMQRWTQKDPLMFGGQQENIYVYAGDDPINGSDPSGLESGDSSPGDPGGGGDQCPYIPKPCLETCLDLVDSVYNQCVEVGIDESACASNRDNGKRKCHFDCAGQR